MPFIVAEVSTAEIKAAFTETGRAISTERAAKLAGDIAAYGGLDRAVAALSHDDALTALGDALAFGAAQAEMNDPTALIARLNREAADLDARAAPAWIEGADLAGKARHRKNQGEHDLADQFLAASLAADRRAAACEAEAFAKRLQAARLQADLARRLDLSAALQAMAALAA